MKHMRPWINRPALCKAGIHRLANDPDAPSRFALTWFYCTKCEGTIHPTY